MVKMFSEIARRGRCPLRPDMRMKDKRPPHAIGIAGLLAFFLGLSASGAVADDASSAQGAPAVQPSSPDQSFEDLWTRPRLLEFEARKRWEELGVTFSGNNINEYLGNLTGGQGNVFDGAGQNSLSANLNLEKLLGWYGGTFVVSYSQRYHRRAAVARLRVRIAGATSHQVPPRRLAPGRLIPRG